MFTFILLGEYLAKLKSVNSTIRTISTAKMVGVGGPPLCYG